MEDGWGYLDLAEGVSSLFPSSKRAGTAPCGQEAKFEALKPIGLTISASDYIIFLIRLNTFLCQCLIPPSFPRVTLRGETEEE